MIMNGGEYEYLNLLTDVMNGDFKGDRTGTGTYSQFGRQIRFDLSKGFPLLTTKKMATKAILWELKWFLNGGTNVKFLHDHNVHIWDEWQREDGSLGKIYGRQWRHWDTISIKEPMVFETPFDTVIQTPFSKNIQPDYSSNESGLIGKVFNSDTGMYTVIKEEKIPRKDNDQFHYKRFTVKFHNTGYEKSNNTSISVKKGLIKDRYAPTVCGVGCIGDVLNDPDYKLVYQTWCKIIDRCYNQQNDHFNNYGGKGVFVDNRWLIFSNFFQDVKKIEGWLLKKTFPNEYTLDKDYNCSNKYGPDTCIWVSKEEQTLNQNEYNLLKAIWAEGEVLCMGIKFAAKKFGLNYWQINDVINNGEVLSGIKFETQELTTGIPRTRIYDQIKIIISLIKNDPCSRRIILNAWNVGELNDMALSPCHTMAQFYVNNGKLSCQLYQRSADLFLGVPFNIASYAMLTHLVAKECGLEVGDFIHTFGDVHIYANHVEQVTEQLSRSPLGFPTVNLDNAGSLFDFNPDGVVFENYNCHSAIKALISV